ncbi:MAG: HAMP domain-containing histidine kinase [Verrucomicrobia bacterium]|nr:HAMP domain-containing histidine kinase [Verrucomicrobiota bacterium]
MVVTAIALFVFALVLLKRIARNEEVILRQQRALISAEKRAMAGLLACSVAHDIRNILGVMDFNIAEIRNDANLEGANVRAIEEMASAVDKIKQMSIRLMRDGRGAACAEGEDVDLGVVFCEIMSFIRSHEAARHCDFSTRITGPLRVKAKPALLYRALVNLVLNGVQAIEGIGKVELRAIRKDECVILEVHDSGPGVNPEDREEIFKPFYTTKEDGNGLGLVSVKACVRELGGKIEVIDSDFGGACFRFLLPVSDS